MRLGRRYAGLLGGRRSGGATIELEYPPTARNEPRWGRRQPPHPALAKLIAEHDDRYEEAIELIAGHREALAAIAAEPDAEDQPTFSRPNWFGGLDACSLYSFIRAQRPGTYVEIGSGVSTTFADRARRDGGLDTRIVSIDPQPRRPIQQLCDASIAQPLEEADLSLFHGLLPGDVVLFDGSHRVFMNSDVVVFFLDVLPVLAPGILVGIHDVFLPDDYPAEYADRYYSEQYMLAAWLLGGGHRTRLRLASHYVCKCPPLNARWREVWSGIAQAHPFGSSFWIEIAE